MKRNTIPPCKTSQPVLKAKFTYPLKRASLKLFNSYGKSGNIPSWGFGPLCGKTEIEPPLKSLTTLKRVTILRALLSHNIARPEMIFTISHPTLGSVTIKGDLINGKPVIFINGDSKEDLEKALNPKGLKFKVVLGNGRGKK
jgi:hypothetical protein